MCWPELIFVTNITNYIRGEKICQLEKFQLSIYDNYGEIENFSTCGEVWKNLGNFEKFGEILPQFTRFHVKKN